LHREVLAFLLEKDQPELAGPIVEVLRDMPAGRRVLRGPILNWLARHPTPAVLDEVVKLWAQEASTTGPYEQRYRRIVEGIRHLPWDEALLAEMNAEEFYARGSALEVLCARVPEFSLRRRFAIMTAYTDATAAIKTFLERFSYLPKTREALRATVSIHKTRQEMLESAARLARQWRADYDYQFDIRDFHLISRMALDPLRMSVRRSELILYLAKSLARRQHVWYRPAGVESRYDARFAPQVEALSMSDLWNLYLLDEMLARPRVQRALRIMAVQSQAGHEPWGGLIFYSSGKAEAILYPPREEGGQSDLAYNMCARGRIDGRDALCRFTVHFDEVDKVSRVGPDRSELRDAQRSNYYALVLSRVSEEQFCAHYYNPNGTVISLGRFPFRQP